MNKTLISIAILILASAGIYFLAQGGASTEPKTALGGQEMIVYKTPTCGCCHVYTQYMDKKGVNVRVVEMDDLKEIKEEYGIPFRLESCHTSVVGGYVVEGHIPLEIVEKLLAEKPDIRGIALPGMPSGSPGMPGPKTGEWTIYALGNDGEITEYMKY